MPSTPLFIDPTTGELDFDRLAYEAIPIAKLIALAGGVALVPLGIAALLGRSVFAGLFAVAGQFVLAVGSALVLLYVVRRAIQLSEDGRGDAAEADADA
ncbi:hypothetical protein G9464_04250 [Halostella sp. JP-L12]|uniref:hypothetical protein n=1 Tax=Halostella TaxID=1843185 RepID=UPI000EF76BEA|nr:MULTISPECIES: hypothetical protein [Halostella]NHN46808.1 hypothetical protein [Halostella sp. JP-L12]